MSLKWYVLSVRSGSEDRVEKEVSLKLKKLGYSELVNEVFVPKKKVVKLVSGKKVESFKSYFPGYIFIHMESSMDLFSYIPGLDNISGFLGIGSHCTPISDIEVERIKYDIENDSSVEQLKSDYYSVGDSVKIVDEGPFLGFSGVISDKLDNNKLKVSVLIFGRATDLQLNSCDVEKIDL